MSTRSVALRDGVTPTTIYTYVDDMADLLNAVGDDALAAIDLDPLAAHEAAGIRAGLRSTVLAVAELLASHPGLTALFASRRIVGPHSLRLNEALLGAFGRAGLSPGAAADAAYALTAYLHGHFVCSVPDDADATVGRALRRLDPADFPLTAAVRDSPDRLPGLDAILDGLLAQARPRA